MLRAGRVDDVINVSGHRIGTAEVEAALDSHKDVAEAAVVPCHHDIKGQGIYAFVSLMSVRSHCGSASRSFSDHALAHFDRSSESCVGTLHLLCMVSPVCCENALTSTTDA